MTLAQSIISVLRNSDYATALEALERSSVEVRDLRHLNPAQERILYLLPDRSGVFLNRLAEKYRTCQMSYSKAIVRKNWKEHDMTDTPTPEETPKATHGGARAGAGRPAGAKNKKAASSYVLQIRMDSETEQRLKARAEAENSTVSDLVRGLIHNYLLSSETE